MKRYNIYEVDLSLKRGKIYTDKMKKLGKKNGNVLTREEIIQRNRKISASKLKYEERITKEYVDELSRKISERIFATSCDSVPRRRNFLKKHLLVVKPRERDFCGVVKMEDYKGNGVNGVNKKKVNKTGVIRAEG